MFRTFMTAAALSIIAVPAAAAVQPGLPGPAAATGIAQPFEYNRHSHDHGSRDHGHYGNNHRHHDRYDGNNDRRHHHRDRCRYDHGTTGLLVGAAIGGAVGNGVAGDGDKTAGTLIGAAGGGLIGKNIDDGVKCR